MPWTLLLASCRYTQTFASLVRTSLHQRTFIGRSVTLVNKDCRGFLNDVWLFFSDRLRTRMRRVCARHGRSLVGVDSLKAAFPIEFLHGACFAAYADNVHYRLPSNNSWKVGRRAAPSCRSPSGE